jgi:phosphomannomutase
MGIFKAYDIRGVVPAELDAALAKKIGNSFARFLKAKRLVVGQDMRTHSPEIADAVSQGMRDAGADVIRLGLSETPMAYFAIGSLECDGGLCVTASHNPGQYNGMKLCREGAKPISKDTGIAEIEKLCALPYPAPVAKPGKETKREVLQDYAAHVAKFAGLGREVRVAIDAANGMAGYTLPAVLERVPRIQAHTLYMEPDGTFPNHEANPLIERATSWTWKSSVARSRPSSASPSTATRTAAASWTSRASPRAPTSSPPCSRRSSCAVFPARPSSTNCAPRGP